MGCVTGKRTYFTEEDALEALIGAHINFGHTSGNGPINYYQCRDCDNFHLTSRGETHPELTKPEVKKRIALEREAQQWERKLR